MRCVPYYYVVGAWQSGGQALNAKLARHPQVDPGPGAPHFWNEDRPMHEYVARFDHFAAELRGRVAEGGGAEEAAGKMVVGDASPGVLANSWAESTRLHRAFVDTVRECWQACQRVSDAVPSDAPEGAPSARRMCIDGHATYRPEVNVGCAAKAVAIDPPREHPEGHALSVPHLMRAVYGEREVKIIAVLREPAARLHSAFWNYEHYRTRFGATEDGFDAFVDEFVDRFEECAREFDEEGCAHRFEAYGPKYEAVFYHADQLIKTLYATFLEGWLRMFGGSNVLVLRTEDVFSESPGRRREALTRAAAHLGLDAPSEEVLDEMDATNEDVGGDLGVVGRSMGTGWAGAGGHSSAEMHPATRRKLDAFFAPQKEALVAMFGDERLRWADQRE